MSKYALALVLCLCSCIAVGCREDQSPSPAQPRGAPQDQVPATTPPPGEVKHTGDDEADPSSSNELESAWVVEGEWTGVAADDRTRLVHLISATSQGMTVNDSGETLNEFTFDGDVDIVRSANIAGAEEAELLAYQHWGTVAAHDSNGDKLWVYSDGQGVDDVCAHDLDGDGLDEVVVGYNGATGLHALDHAGNLLWKDTDIGNVWHVSAGDVNGDGSPDVATTSATGKLHIFGASGEKLQDLDPGIFAKLVRLTHVADEDEAMTILAAGPDGDMLGLVALDGDGSRRWITHLEAAGINYPISGEPAPGRPWFAIAVSGGWVYVVDVTNGEVVASASDQGMKTQVGWLAGEAGEAPLLLAATGDSLNAFHVPDE